MSKSTKKGSALDNASPEELKRIEECLKQPEFIKLLEDYAKEISDPSAKQAHDLYISQLEREVLSDESKDSSGSSDAEYMRQMLKENGQELMKPAPWFCFKTKLADKGEKVFINICTSKLIEPASKTTSMAPSAAPAAEIRTGNLLGGKGSNWRIPYALSPARDCKDHAGSKSVLYDFTVGEGTKAQSETVPHMKNLLIQTAIEGISEQTKAKLDSKDFAVMTAYTHKGGEIPAYPIRLSGAPIPAPSQLTPATATAAASKPNNSKPLPTSPAPSSPATPAPKPSTSATPAPSKPLIEPVSSPAPAASSPSAGSGSSVATPVYRVVERGEMEGGQFGFEREDLLGIRRPKELIIKIELPLLSSIADVDLEMSQRKLVLRHPSYFLELPLAYPVNEDKAAAQFKKAQHLLTVTLPVLPLSKEEMATLQAQKKEVEAARSLHKPADPTDGAQQAVVELEAEDAPFDYQDRLDRVVVAVRVPAIDSASVDSSFTSTSCEMQFKAAGKRYQLQLGPLFDSIVPEKCTFTVSADNLIIKLFKANEGLWVCLTDPSGSKQTASPLPATQPSATPPSRPADVLPPVEPNQSPPVPPSAHSFESLTAPNATPNNTKSDPPSAASAASSVASPSPSPVVAVPLPPFLNQRSVKSLGVDPSVAFRSKTSSVSASAESLPPILYASSFLFQTD